jgi:hypothetical protein
MPEVSPTAVLADEKIPDLLKNRITRNPTAMCGRIKGIRETIPNLLILSGSLQILYDIKTPEITEKIDDVTAANSVSAKE